MKLPYLKELIFLAAVLLSLLLIEIPLLKVPVAGILIIIYGFTSKPKFSKIGLILPSNYPIQVVLSIPLAIMLVALSYYLFTPVIESLTGYSLDYSSYSPIVANKQAFFGALIIGWIIGGFFEELIFRGFLLQKIQDLIPSKYSGMLAVLLTSLLFGYLHQYQGVGGQILTGVVGLILGIITLMNKRSIWMSMCVHGFTNTISLLVIYKGWVEL